MLRTNKRSRTVQRASAILVGLGLAACAHPEHVQAPVEPLAPPKIVEQAPRPQIAEHSTNHEATATPAPKTWLSREEVEANQEAEREHAWNAQTFWTMRKDRPIQLTNIGPSGTSCICAGGDPLCTCYPSE